VGAKTLKTPEDQLRKLRSFISGPVLEEEKSTWSWGGTTEKKGDETRRVVAGQKTIDLPPDPLPLRLMQESRLRLASRRGTSTLIR